MSCSPLWRLTLSRNVFLPTSVFLTGTQFSKERKKKKKTLKSDMSFLERQTSILFRYVCKEKNNHAIFLFEWDLWNTSDNYLHIEIHLILWVISRASDLLPTILCLMLLNSITLLARQHLVKQMRWIYLCWKYPGLLLLLLKP